MTEQKQPQAGEYWQKDGKRLCVIGTKKNGVPVGETECGNLIPFLPIHDWQHLPDCDSFDWQPEVWPKLYVHCDADCDWCVEQYKVDRIRVHRVTGVEDQPWVAMYSTNIADGTWIKVTEAEALARVKPVESPDDWVTQDRVPSRSGIDQRRYRYSDSTYGEWDDSGCIAWDERRVKMHGATSGSATLELRCRRKDLPPVESPKPVTVRLWRSPGLLSVVAADDPPTIHWQEIKHDGYKFYVEEQR